MPASQNVVMLQGAIDETTAPCPKCRTDMVLAAITPHPAAPHLARHTYLCGPCNRTKTYILPAIAPADREGERVPSDSILGRDGEFDDRRQHPREAVATPASIYNRERIFLLPCMVRDLSKTGGRLELFKEAILPQYFLLSLLPDGSSSRLCSKVWQIGLIAGLRFVES
jgi:hypothetical protein